MMLCKLIFFALEVLFSVCSNTFTGQQWFRLALEVNIQTLIHLLLCLLHSCIVFLYSAQPLLCFPGLHVATKCQVPACGLLHYHLMQASYPPVMHILRKRHHWRVLVFVKN